MQISTERRGDVSVVSLTGSLDALTAGQLTAFLDGQVEEGASRLVADLSNLEYVSSSGLRSFLGAAKTTRQAGGDLRLAGAQPNVGKVLEMSGFTSILKSYPDVDSAVSSFA